LETAFQTTDPPLRLLAAFQHAYPDQPMEWVMRAPGREMWIAAARADAEEFTLVMADTDAAKVTFNLQSAKGKKTVLQRPLPRWARYPAGVTLILAQEGLDVIGLKMVVIGDEPPGPRYDYGLGITFAALWQELHGLPYTIDDLIVIVDRARRDYIEESAR
jgi:galactokinase